MAGLASKRGPARNLVGGQTWLKVGTLRPRWKRIIKEQLDVDEKDIKPESTFFIDDLGADSLGLVELVLAFEEAFEIDIPGRGHRKRFETVQDAVDYIEKERQEVGAGDAIDVGRREAV